MGLGRRAGQEGGYLLKTVMLVLLAASLGGTGHVLLSRGMRRAGDLTDMAAGHWLSRSARAVASPWVICGVALQASFFLIYLTLLSRADITLVLPLTAADYVVVAVLAQFLLGETVTAVRWTGIGLVTAGILVMSRTG
jgi:drug/metabolite transporter (DMT)-like permease